VCAKAAVKQYVKINMTQHLILTSHNIYLKGVRFQIIEGKCV